MPEADSNEQLPEDVSSSPAGWRLRASRFVLLFDIMGFRHMLQTLHHRNIHGILTGLLEDVRDRQDYAAETGTRVGVVTGSTPNAEGAKDGRLIEAVIFSDSIIAFTKNASGCSHAALNEFALYLFHDAAFKGIPSAALSPAAK